VSHQAAAQGGELIQDLPISSGRSIGKTQSARRLGPGPLGNAGNTVPILAIARISLHQLFTGGTPIYYVNRGLHATVAANFSPLMNFAG